MYNVQHTVKNYKTDKNRLKTNTLIRDKIGYYIMIKGSFKQKNITCTQHGNN